MQHAVTGLWRFCVCTCTSAGPTEAFSKWGGRAPKTREILGGYGGMLPCKMLESRVSEMAFPGFLGEILEKFQDCKIIRTAPNGFFNISLTLITGVRRFLILPLNDAILSTAQPLTKLKDTDYLSTS